MKKDDRIVLEIGDINNLGCGVGRAEDGRVVFVKGAVTGDVIEAKIIKVNKKFLVARTEKLVTASPYRVDMDICSAPLSCGGCVYRHIKYEHELEIKRDYVKNAFVKVGLSDVEVLPVMNTGKIAGYRNKGQFPLTEVKGKVTAGFYASKSHNIVPSNECTIQNPAFSPIVTEVCRFATEKKISVYNEETGKGILRHIYLRIAEKTGQIMLCVVVNADSLPYSEEFVTCITERFPNISGVILNINKKNTNVVLGDRFITLFGKEYIVDELCGLRFKISPQSFYQVNRDGAEMLYTEAAKKAALCGNEVLMDLYCGTGTIGLSMAKNTKKLVGIEIVESAVECAKENAERNGIENAEFYCADASDKETILKCAGGVRPDVVVIDPPRKGTTRELVECLDSLNVPKVVYVSCDPDTLARDCVCFREFGYEIGEVQPVDMFARTGHVESIVCLSRKTTHEMKLHASPFEKIKSGVKNIELRLFDEKRQKIKAGDDIIFTNTASGEKMRASVKKLHLFGSFEELYKTLPLLQCGYTAEDIDTAHPSDMEQYYSAEEQSKYGIVGIELFPPKRITDESVVCLTKK